MPDHFAELRSLLQDPNAHARWGEVEPRLLDLFAEDAGRFEAEHVPYFLDVTRHGEHRPPRLAPPELIASPDARLLIYDTAEVAPDDLSALLTTPYARELTRLRLCEAGSPFSLDGARALLDREGAQIVGLTIEDATPEALELVLSAREGALAGLTELALGPRALSRPAHVAGILQRSPHLPSLRSLELRAREDAPIGPHLEPSPAPGELRSLVAPGQALGDEVWLAWVSASAAHLEVIETGGCRLTAAIVDPLRALRLPKLRRFHVYPTEMRAPDLARLATSWPLAGAREVQLGYTLLEALSPVLSRGHHSPGKSPCVQLAKALGIKSSGSKDALIARIVSHLESLAGPPPKLAPAEAFGEAADALRALARRVDPWPGSASDLHRHVRARCAPAAAADPARFARELAPLALEALHSPQLGFRDLLCSSPPGDDEPGALMLLCEELLEPRGRNLELLAGPYAANLRQLTCCDPEHGQAALAALASNPALGGLRALELGVSPDTPRALLDALAEAPLGELRALTLHMRGDAHGWREASERLAGFVASIAAGACPELEELVLRDVGLTDEAAADLLAALATRSPALSRLSCRGSRTTGALLDALRERADALPGALRSLELDGARVGPLAALDWMHDAGAPISLFRPSEACVVVVRALGARANVPLELVWPREPTKPHHVAVAEALGCGAKRMSKARLELAIEDALSAWPLTGTQRSALAGLA
jgi:hypothetical protein